MQAIVKNINHNWVREENQLMIRLHRMITGSEYGPFEKDSGYRWQLDASNDWWAELRGDDLVVAHRYSQEKADALAEMCRVLFTGY